MSHVPAITVEMGKHDVGKRKEERVRMGRKVKNVESKIYTVTKRVQFTFMIFNINAMKGPPMTHDNPKLFTLSEKNNP